MAAFIHITVDGGELQGSSAIQTMGGVDLTDHTQVLSMYFDASVSERDVGRMRSASNLVLSPVTIVKAVDGISPRLQAAFHESQNVDAQIRCFTRHPQTGESMEAHVYTLLQSRIVGIRVELPDYGSDIRPPLERVSILPTIIRSTSELSNENDEWTTYVPGT